MKIIPSFWLLTLFSWNVAFSEATKTSRSSAPDTTHKVEESRPWAYIGTQLGFEFIDMKQQGLFDGDVQQVIRQIAKADSQDIANNQDTSRTLRSRSTRTLQPYNKVLLGFPWGLHMGFSLGRHWDLTLASQSLWKEEKTILESTKPDTILFSPADTLLGGKSNFQRQYGWSLNSVGAGLKFYIPLHFLSLNPNIQLFVGFLTLWNVNGELYTEEGVSSFAKSPYPTTTEFYSGFQLSRWKNVSFLGLLSIGQTKVRLNSSLNTLVAQEIEDSKNIEWNSLKFNFQLLWHVIN